MSLSAAITAIDYHLPEAVLGNEELAARYPEWPAEKIEGKLGIRTRRIAAENETAGDLAYQAARKLFDSGRAKPEEIDFLLLCTQSPDYFLPTTACILQDRLGIPTTAGALDFNLGCSGYLYGLAMAKGLIASGSARNVLLLTAETYSKFIHPDDRGVRTLFGDGAAATLVRALPSEADAPDPLGPFVFGTDGSGHETLVVRTGALRQRQAASADDPAQFLAMDGPAIFAFTLRRIPGVVRQLLDRSQLTVDQIDLFVFHQANRFMLESLCVSCGLPRDRFVIDMAEAGNTVSSTIPIALCNAERQSRLHPGMRVMLLGFGVGLSWSGAVVRMGTV